MAKDKHETGYAGISLPTTTKIRGGENSVIQPSYGTGAGPTAGAYKKSDRYARGDRKKGSK